MSHLASRSSTALRSFTLLLAALLLSSCMDVAARSDLPPPQVTRLEIPLHSSSTSLPPAPADLPEPEDFPPPPTAQPAATQAPASPTTALHPMYIEAQRQKQYPGSEIVIEETLERGLNYSRHYAYYLSEGLKIFGLLTIPDGETPPTGWPSIVFVHGYIPPEQYRTTERYIAYVDWLARSEYIIFRIDLRGHDRSEGLASGAYSDPGYLADVLNAVASLRSYPLADPERIGMWGHSMGGYLTLRAMVISPHIRAGVIWAGVVGSYQDMLERWRRNTGPTPTPFPSRFRWRQAWVETYGTPEDNPDFWNSISANSYLSDISGPLQLHHAFDDTDVPIVFSEELYADLLEARKTVEYYSYENDNHNISNSFSQAMTRTIYFYDLYLKNSVK